MIRAVLLLLTLAAPTAAQEVLLVNPYPVAKTTTAANLPTCGASLTGAVAVVTNALTPVLGLAVVGGGAVTVVVKCNGTSWLVGQ